MPPWQTISGEQKHLGAEEACFCGWLDDAASALHVAGWCLAVSVGCLMSLHIVRAVGISIVHACRVEAMQQGTEGTERFCIKQLLKPIDNVRHLDALSMANLLQPRALISRRLHFVASCES